MKTEILKVTPKMAMEILEKNKNNRRLYDRTVKVYSDQMTRGQWRLTGQGISISSNGDVLDGQHRLQAVVKSGMSIDFLFISGVDNSTFDVYDSGKNRTSGDVLFIDGVKNANNIAAIMAKYFMIKLKTYSIEANRTREMGYTKHDYLLKYNEQSELWQELHSISIKCRAKINLYHASIVGGLSAYLILDKKYPKEVVEKFMYELFGILPDSSTATKLLRDTLFKNAMSPKQYNSQTKLVFLIKTWNNYITGRNIKLLRFNPDEKYPELI